MKVLNFIYILIPLFFLFSCDDDNYETLPYDLDNAEQHDTLEHNDTDTVENPCDGDFVKYGDECIKTALAVATTEGYNTPFGGHIRISWDETLSKLEEITLEEKIGDASGTDISLSASDDRLMVVQRNTASKLNVIHAPLESGETEEYLYSISEGFYNFHDAVYDSKSENYYVSANQSNSLQIFNNRGREELELEGFYDETYSSSPSAMIKIGDKIYTALQMLDSEWTSKGGTVAVYDTVNKTFEKITLPFFNPSGKFAWNPESDPDKIYIACTGAWQASDGGVAQISLKDNSALGILEESSDENSILNGDFVDISVANDGSLYMIVSDSSHDWVNHIVEYKASTGVVSETDTNVNGAAARPLDYSPATNTLYYFKDDGAKTYLNAKKLKDNTVETYELTEAGTAVKVWIRYNK